MELLWIVPLLWAGQDHRRVADLKIDGMTSQACHVAVGKALAAAPSVERVVFRVSKHGNRVHAVLKKEALPLREVEEALAAARQEMKDTLRMTVDYRLDEADLRLPAGTRFAVDGEDRKTGTEMTLAEFRKSQPFSSLDLPSVDHPSCAFICPEGCSAADEEAICPRCGSDLEKVEAPSQGG